VLRAGRQDWARTAELRDTYRQHRPMVERSIAWLIGPKGRCRQRMIRRHAAHRRMPAWLLTTSVERC
jgi:hypothetical protein